MTYYHCSPVGGLRMLEPRRPEAFDKPARVYMTTLLPMALMYGVHNFEYTYGYTKEGQIYLDEYFPGALQEIYGGRSASLYICAPAKIERTVIPNEVVACEAVAVLEEMVIPDVLEALLEQERLGQLPIHRYECLSPKMLAWIRQVEADVIRKKDMLHQKNAMSVYFRTHYPESWEMVEKELQEKETK